MARVFSKENRVEVLWYMLGLLGMALLMCFLGVMIVSKDITACVKYIKEIFLISLMSFGFLVIVFVYQMTVVKKSQKKGYSRVREYLIVNTAIVLTVLFSCAMYVHVSPYAVPIATSSFLIAILLSQRVGILSGVCSYFILMVICPVTSYLQYGVIEVAQLAGLIVALISSICMTFLVHKGYTRLKITIGALIIGFLMFPFGIPLGLISENPTFAHVATTCIFCFLGNAIAIGFAVVVLPIYERLYRVWTDFRLAEVCTLNQPLLIQLRDKAPGTFSHSLVVATLAENCAIALGLNPFMARACAMYHDVGKIKTPEFFVENQAGGYNPHDDLIIDVSVKMITEHPEVGAHLLKEAHLPDTVIKAAYEHHGDSTLMFFYLKAKGITEGDLEADKYRYENPRPSTKYSAIIMICDMCEATLRAKKPSSLEELESIVYKIIEGRILDGQFSDCNISMQDLHKIKNSVCQAMPALLHERIDYEKAKERR